MWRGYWRFLLPYRIGRCHRRAFAHSCSGARQEFDRFFLCEEQHRVLDAILHFLHSLYNPDGLKELIRSGGAPLICAIVFVETGFFVGFFLPGDSLLVTARQVRLYIAAKTPSSSAAATFNAPVTSIKNMAAGPLFSRASFPSFERSVRPSLVPRKCLTPATSPSTSVEGLFGSAP